jgi:hypothetical protein
MSEGIKFFCMLIATGIIAYFGYLISSKVKNLQAEIDLSHAVVVSELSESFRAQLGEVNLSLLEAIGQLDYSLRQELAALPTRTELLAVLRNDYHNFTTRGFDSVSPAIFYFSDAMTCTGFGLEIDGVKMLVSAKHCVHSNHGFLHPNMDLAILDPQFFPALQDISFMKVSDAREMKLGSPVHSLGYRRDDGLTGWVGSITGIGSKTHPEMRLASGNQLPRMSGSPVFSDCGLVGVAVSVQFLVFRFPSSLLKDISTGTGIIPFSCLKEFSEKAPRYNLHSNKIIPVPTKAFC